MRNLPTQKYGAHLEQASKLVKEVYLGGLGLCCIGLTFSLSFGLYAVLQNMEALISRQLTLSRAGMCQRMKGSPCNDPSTRVKHVLGAWYCVYTLPAFCPASAPCDAGPHFQGQAAFSRTFWRNVIDMSIPCNYLHYLNKQNTVDLFNFNFCRLQMFSPKSHPGISKAIKPRFILFWRRVCPKYQVSCWMIWPIITDK